ncbi:MAG: ion channel [Erythrobacter sp.]|uniref:potassium channel family protein n=1 Tax=Erythrobacter sp. TaxID=1042 RepID=UPI0026218BBB|nr:potassium channel family protein [Erythrobacter sp.]MDJ0979471.1 ion channel [Erythrobacter sp.]
MTTLFLTAILIAATIIIHYEILRLARLGVTDLGVHPPARLWIMLGSAIISHLIHIMLYAGAYLLLEFQFGLGAIDGPDSGSFNDAFYFSIVCYTTLGFGDIVPAGELRLMSGIEALNGLVMITWTASLTYLHMERFWNVDARD